MKVLVDAFGGDNAPLEIIKGSLLALEEHKDLIIELFGDEDIIKKVLAEVIEESKSNKFFSNKKIDRDELCSRILISDAKEVISCDEAPVVAVKTKKDSSLVKAVDKLKNDEESVGLVSAGSTGAVLTAGFLKLGRIRGIKRPALAPALPTINGKQVLVIDCGANMDCDEYNLLQFAQMGNAYMKIVLGVENPRIALLSVGVEDAKGNELTKKVFALLKESNLNFVGNMEARDALSGDYDVIVCDGFAGNVLIKSVEGTAQLLMSVMKKGFLKNLKTKVGAVLLKGAIKDMKSMLDYHSFGGSPFLGAKKLIIKSHGSSKAKSIHASINQVVTFTENKLIENIEKAIAVEDDND
ncbi:MAG: phosphate acyltransferase PlsX [Clostridia bacterium]|nr:phosphate acyltransferase PlsX [Clostridia bacterium]